MDGAELRLDAEIDETDLACQAAGIACQAGVRLDGDQMMNPLLEAFCNLSTQLIGHVRCDMQGQMLSLPLLDQRMMDGVQRQLANIEVAEDPLDHPDREVDHLAIGFSEMAVGVGAGFGEQTGSGFSTVLSPILETALFLGLVGRHRLRPYPLGLGPRCLHEGPAGFPSMNLGCRQDTTPWAEPGLLLLSLRHGLGISRRCHRALP